MGVDGFGWVLWVPGDTGDTKNKTRQEQNDCAAHDLGPMAGEISPDIMFSGKIKKKCAGDF